jgi:MoxR-like ATPase
LQRVEPGLLDWQQLNRIGALIQHSVQASEALERYALDVWDATRDPQRFGIALPEVEMDRLILAGASPRGMMALMRAARVVAWLDGRNHLLPDDIVQVVPATLGHRIFFTPLYELRRGLIADALIAQIIDRVATPR